jgi:hypothetical protein
MIPDVYTPSVPEPDESLPTPTLPAPPPGISAVPAARRKLPVKVIPVALGATLGVLIANGALPVAKDEGLLPVVGLLLALSLHSVLTALLGPLSGLTTVYASVGIGRRLGDATVGGVLVTFRLLPLMLFTPCAIITDRPGLVRRLWWGTAAQVLGLAAVGAVLAAAGGPGGAALGWGFLVFVLLVVVLAPGRVTSPAWRLWRMPLRREAAKLEEWRNDAATVEAVRAVGAGRFDAARAALAGAPPSDSPRRQAVVAQLALVEGRYQEAAQEASALHARSSAPSLRAAALYLYARAMSDGVQSGHWPAEQALPHFAAAVAALRAEMPAQLARSDLAARDAYYRGDAARAIRLAKRAASLAPERLSRAAALQVLADARRLPGARTAR